MGIVIVVEINSPDERSVQVYAFSDEGLKKALEDQRLVKRWMTVTVREVKGVYKGFFV